MTISEAIKEDNKIKRSSLTKAIKENTLYIVIKISNQTNIIL
jgi:hypothetical protein